MSLRDKLKADAIAAPQRSLTWFQRFGIVENPFPPAGQPAGHPHMETSVDDEVFIKISSFTRDNTSQVLVIEGNQGVGKTNLLAHYENELREAYREEPSYYVIRYYMDPEPSFDGILRRLFQELGTAHLKLLAIAISRLSVDEQERITELVRSHEVRAMLLSLSKAANDAQVLEDRCELALEWLTGLRVLNRHRDELCVQYRLDTVESKTQALRDIVECSCHLGTLKAIFLLLDELEKQDYSVSKMMLLRYLSAVRAIIDALPRHLFLMIALTSVARRRYFEILPAFAGRLQNIIALHPLRDADQAYKLSAFYLGIARQRARDTMTTGTAGKHDPLPEAEVVKLFEDLLERAVTRGSEGVSQRDFLNQLHIVAENVLQSV